MDFTASINRRECILPYRSRCHLHYLESEEVGVFLQDAGIDLMEADTVFNKWNECGHVDFPLEIQEKIESNLKEKRNYPSSHTQFFINTFNIS